MEHRSQAERDAVTVEIGFAVLTGALLAGAAFVAVCAPAFLMASGGGVGPGLLLAATVVAGLVFVGRVVDVLWRFGRRVTEREVDGRVPVLPDQPSQPGRTSPDS
ncbi:hypothetical protein JGS39_29215 [Streptomyces sp. P01-B04]|uniref:DUF6332 family protein n=1 Tax=Streptomyces poriferorum TaxID=2798799 RepID=UPI001C607D18|nr:DUF6332 family protein [Streptomyces poriferorum]MBW5253008.1 hypothetical protein [Streptomyces poriferorum]MBW5259217.1 hypothetical protein [Streptomyces poriferorum]